MRRCLRLGGLAATVWLIVAGAAQAEPLRISYFTWVGYGPLFVAQEKGFFAKEGVEVELINIDDHTAAFAGLFAGQVDAILGATQDVLTFSEPDEDPLECLLPLADSRGGDGILANKDIRTIADLKGKSVAFLEGSISEFYLNVLLKEVVDLSPDDAAEAFMLQEVDAAVTYDPALTRAKNTAHGHLLTDTSERPGLLGDCLMAKADVFDERKEDFRAVARAWAAAVDYAKAHPEEANAIMARSLGGWLEDPAVFAEIMKGVGLYDAKTSRDYLGTPEAPGPIYDTMQYGIDVMSSLGRLKVQVTPADLIAHGIFDE